MTLASEVNFFGLSLVEVVILAGFIAYVVSLWKDWRPMKALRQENSDLRAALTRAEANFEDHKRESEKRINDLTDELARVKRATDLSPLHEGQRKIVEVLDGLVVEVKALDSAVRGNTAAVEVLGKRRVIDDALRESGAAGDDAAAA